MFSSILELLSGRGFMNYPLFTFCGCLNCPPEIHDILVGMKAMSPKRFYADIVHSVKKGHYLPASLRAGGALIAMLAFFGIIIIASTQIANIVITDQNTPHVHPPKPKLTYEMVGTSEKEGAFFQTQFALTVMNTSMPTPGATPKHSPDLSCPEIPFQVKTLYTNTYAGPAIYGTITCTSTTSVTDNGRLFWL